MTVLSPFRCSRCGGAVSVREGSRLGRCSHCGTSFLAQFPGDDARFAVPPGLDERAAGARVRELLAAPDLPGDLASKAVLQSTDLFFVPYWRIQATVVGRLRGTRKVRRRGLDLEHDGEGGRVALYRTTRETFRTENVDKPIREIWGATLSACPVDDLGVPTLSPLRQRSAGMLVTRKLGALPGIRFFDASLFRLGKVLDVMVPRERAREQAEKLFQKFVDSRGFDVDQKQMRYLRLQERCYLLYYPVHRVRFRYQGRIYQVTVDGHHGGVIQAHLPTEPRHSLGVVLGATLVTALLTAAPLRMVLFSGGGTSSLAGEPRFWGGVGLAAVALTYAARYALTHLRFETEKVVHG